MPAESARKKRQTDSGERVLWASDLTASSDWRTVAETFYQEGRWLSIHIYLVHVVWVTCN